MVEMKCNIPGIVSNLNLSKHEALLPVFEAVVNSIQAIEDKGNVADGTIEIHIMRNDKQGTIKDSRELPIDGFKIIDNGVGFNSENFISFNLLFSEHKKQLGAKGFGRFLWLKAFKTVDIKSVYFENGKKSKRCFSFSDKGVSPQNDWETTENVETVVTLSGFKEEYRHLSSAYKTNDKIAQRILEHCLVYFVTENVPNIEVIDQNRPPINLNEFYKSKIKAHTEEENVLIKNQPFHFIHLKLFDTHEKAHKAVLCAHKRDVESINITRKLGGAAQFDEDHKKFIYAVYISSPSLDSTVDLSRQNFNIQSKAAPLLPNELSREEIEDEIIRIAKVFLKPFLDKIKSLKEERVQQFVSEIDPSLRHIPHYCPELLDEIQPNIIDADLSEILYRFKGKVEHKLKNSTRKLLKAQIQSMAELDEKCKEVTEQLNVLQKDDLVSYVCRRKAIIDLLEKKLGFQEDGKYSTEGTIHDIIFPRKTTTDELQGENHNLWIIDECLVFHNYAASDKPLSEFTSSVSQDRPDIVIFADIDEDKVALAVSIVELKKPQRQGSRENPVEQMYSYLDKIRNTKRVKLKSGRDLRVDEKTRYYCYAICDIDDNVHKFINYNGGYSELKNKLGYFHYNNILHIQTEILHFDHIVADVKRRHNAFFKKLGIT